MALDLFARVDYEYPIEEAFKAISVLETVPEFEEEMEIMKKKLEQFFSNITEKNGVKRYNKISYYANGLCEWDNTPLKIILSPWKKKGKLIDKEMSYRLKTLKKINPLWHAQLVLYMKKPLRTKSTKYKDVKQYFDKYNSLSNEEKKFVENNKKKEMYQSRNYLLNLFKVSYYVENIDREKEVFPFLLSSELETLKYSLESFDINLNSFSILYSICDVISAFDFSKKKEKDETREVVSLKARSLFDTLQNDFKTTEKIVSEVKKIKNENIVNIVKKYGII